jgi:hypothetical protein
MKTLHFIMIALAVLPVSAETVVINGKTIEIPDSEVGGVLQNQDITARLQAIKARIYQGTAVGQKANVLLAKINREGPTDANVSALAELEKKLSEPAPTANAPDPAKSDPKRVAFNVAIQNGFDTGMGFKLAIGDADRNAFTQMLVLVNTAKEKGVINDTTPQTVADIEGKPHTVTTAQFTGLMLAYGAYYKGIWDKLKTGN